MALPKSWKYLKYYKISKWTQTEMFSYHFCISIFVETKIKGDVVKELKTQGPLLLIPSFNDQ